LQKTGKITLKTLIISIALLVMVASCKVSNVEVNKPSADNKYDSEYPSSSISNKIEELSKSIKKIDVIAFYATYYFPADDSIKVDNIDDNLLNDYKKSMKIDHESVIGSASVIFKTNNKVGLLTCAHTVDFNDTIYHYKNSEHKYLNAISIKLRQQVHISGHIKGEPVQVIAKNEKHDIALLVKETEDTDNFTILKTPIGKCQDLQWGTVVYVLGYPLGHLMVTRALVSINDKIKSGYFLTDALFNQGISGSPVFAIRDGGDNFELVGMASSASAQTKAVLTPDDMNRKNHSTGELYTGNIFVDISPLINYGVTFSVTIDEISIFIQSNDKILSREGFIINDFLDQQNYHID
jgi:S1-C subfamily serine protease